MSGGVARADGKVGRLAALGAVGALLVATAVAGRGLGGASAGQAADTAPTPTGISITIGSGGRTPTPMPNVDVDLGDPTPTARPRATEAPAAEPVAFPASAWQGAYYEGSGASYGRAWSALYGAQGEYAEGTLTFALDAAPEEDLRIVFFGLDDELDGVNPIEIRVNGEAIFEGDNPFNSFDGVFPGDDAAWKRARLTVPAERLTEGENTVTIANLSDGTGPNATPYILLAEGEIQAEGVAVEVIAAGADAGQPVPTAQPTSVGEVIVEDILGEDIEPDDDGDDDDDNSGSGGDDDGGGDDDDEDDDGGDVDNDGDDNSGSGGDDDGDD